MTYTIELEVAYNSDATLGDCLERIAPDLAWRTTAEAVHHGWPVVQFFGAYPTLAKMVIDNFDSGADDEVKALVESIKEVE